MEDNSNDENTTPMEEDNDTYSENTIHTSEDEISSENTIYTSEDEISSEKEVSGNSTAENNGIFRSKEGGQVLMEDAESDDKQREENKDGAAVYTCQGDSANKFLQDLFLFRLILLTSRDDRVHSIVISRKASVRDLYEKVSKFLKLDPSRVRISACTEHKKVYLTSISTQALEKFPLQQDQAIYMEISPGDAPDCLQLCNTASSNYLLFPDYLVSDEDDTLCPMEEGASKVLTGLLNLGNTCFMNSAVQCLGHTPPLFEYFRQDFEADVNKQNPLGNKGELAMEFGHLLRKLCSSKDLIVAPRNFKKKIADFAPQFVGDNQHDSHEFLAFLLDGLHEDLNRVKEKPYVERKDADGRLDEEVATEYWDNHKARNDSVIVDVFLGQEKSTLTCPICRKVSVTFDPFMCLSLPMPVPVMRQMTVTIFYCDGSSPPSHYTLHVPRDGSCSDLLNELGFQCMLRRGEESFILVEVLNHRIRRALDGYQKLAEINDNVLLLAYRLPSHEIYSPKLLIYHNNTAPRKNMTRSENSYGRRKKNRRYVLCDMDIYSDHQNRPKFWGAPLLTYLPDSLTLRHQLVTALRRVLQPFLRSNPYNQQYSVEEETFYYMGLDEISDSDLYGEISLCDNEFGENIYKVHLDWSAEIPNFYVRHHIDELPPVNKGQCHKKISLFACFEAFLKEEPLGHDNMWYCSTCKEQREATKKLDLWKLPEILCIQLKRFSSDGNKLQDRVDFPIRGLNLNKYVKGENPLQNHVYDLYAIINHWGNLSRGHYTAYAKGMESDTWYHFDDGEVNVVVDENSIQIPEAYILFYKRVAGDVKGSRIKEEVEIKEV